MFVVGNLPIKRSLTCNSKNIFKGLIFLFVFSKILFLKKRVFEGAESFLIHVIVGHSLTMPASTTG